MADQALTIHNRMGEFLQHFESAGVCFESGFVKAPALQAVDNLDMCGYPVKGDPAAGFELCLEADSAAGIKGWILTDGILNLAAAEVTTRKMLILARGPAVVVEEMFPAADVAGTNFTAANLVAAAEAVGIQMRNIPAESTTQTT